MAEENKVVSETEGNTEVSDSEEYMEIKMGGGWYLTISLATSEKYENEYVEVAKERSGQKRSRFNLNPKHVINGMQEQIAGPFLRLLDTLGDNVSILDSRSHLLPAEPGRTIQSPGSMILRQPTLCC